MDSAALSQKYWQQVPHSELTHYGTEQKTAADVAFLQRFLQPADRILDLGCGWGRVTLALTRTSFDVTGVDLSANLIDFARRSAVGSGLTLRFEVGSMLSIPFDDASFDKIICLWGVFNHLLEPSEQVAAMNEMHRVLRQGGRALIEMDNGESRKYRQIRSAEGSGLENRIWKSQYKEGPPPNVIYIHDRQTMREAAGQSKFAVYQVKFQNIHHKRRIVTYLSKQLGIQTR